jgi:hypothetical protein
MAENVADLLGLPIEFRFTFEGNDLVLMVGERTRRVCGLFSRWVQGEALEGIKRLRGQMTDDDYRIAFDGWRHDLATHKFDWGSPLCWDAVGSVAGTKHLACLQFQAGAEGTGMSMPLTDWMRIVDAIAEDDELWSELLVKMNMSDPNVRRAAAKAAAARKAEEEKARTGTTTPTTAPVEPMPEQTTTAPAPH